MFNKNSFSISGKIIDLKKQRIFEGQVDITNGVISNITEQAVEENFYILPGLIDAHIHIESSMLIPSEFARIATTHGTVATVSDPHEIANVNGIEGVKFMIQNGKKVPFKFFFGAPSSVPATPFETSGFKFGDSELKQLLAMPEIGYLAEMMNFPGVINRDPAEMRKIEIANTFKKPIDGHAPGIKGDSAKKYADAGISTDHECYTLEEAKDKIKCGMKILIREGSAAKNLDTLMELIKTDPEKVMLCSDDKHPDDLLAGHINTLIQRIIAKGYDPLTVLKCAIQNPIEHYGLNVGMLQIGDPADLITVDNLKQFNVLQTYINGTLVAECGKPLLPHIEEKPLNNFHAAALNEQAVQLVRDGDKIKVIKAFDGQLFTESFTHTLRKNYKVVESDTASDILKIVVLNRYKKTPPAIGFINGFNFKSGAIASSIAHDSHNIVAVGTTDREIIKAINLVVKERGGISVVNNTTQHVLPLPFGGLMSQTAGEEVAKWYSKLNNEVKKMGSELKAPYMTLSFMALLVIPHLKLSDKGLFDGDTFEFTPLFTN